MALNKITRMVKVLRNRKGFKWATYSLLVAAFVILSVRYQSNAAMRVFRTAITPEISVESLPVAVPDSLIKPLRTLVDSSLQKSLDKIIAKNKKWSTLAAEKRLCIGLVDMRDVRNVKFARINGSHMMYAASLPKIAILLAAMDAIDKGELEETEEVIHDMRIMISKSDNGAATRMINRVGFDKIADVMEDPEYDFYDEDHGGGLWVGKRYAQAGDRHGDPMKNLSHAASATQVCRYYYLLAFGQLVNFERSEQMLAYLSDPELHHKFVNTLDKVAPKAKVYRKSGSWKTYHADSALVWGSSWRKYILVALADDPNGEQIMRELMMEVDKTLKPKT